MVIPYKTSNFFVGKAKDSGVITEVDEKMKIIKVQYRNGSFDIFEYGDLRGEASGMTFSHEIVPHPNVAVGAKFNKDNIITFHNDFFELDPVTKQLSWCHGVPIKMAIMPKDITLEDSSMISIELANMLDLSAIHTRAVQITTDMVIESFTDVGSEVKFNDSLIRMKYEGTADLIDDVDELFADLRQVEFRSKNEGTIVGIQIYYATDSLNPSLTKFANKVTLSNRSKLKLAKGTIKESDYTTVNIVPEGTRIKGVQLSSTDVLILFHIKDDIACGIGDKIVVGNMLKSVVGKVEHNPMLTEDGKKVDLIFGANSIFDRIVCSVFINGISDTTIESAEDDIVKIYFD